MINVVNEEMVGRIEHFTMHHNMFFLFPDSIPTGGIEDIFALDSVPFVLIQSLEILGIYEGIFALGKRYPAEGAAVADPAVK